MRKREPMARPIQPLLSSVPVKERPGDEPRAHHLDVRVVTVTPAIAQEWLGSNIGNRNRKDANVEKYHRDMSVGRWALTGEPIIFDSVGHLRNGQNRLFACIKANAPFKCLVVWGVEPESFVSMDRGAIRSNADVLSINGEANATAVASACGFIWRQMNGKALDQGGKTTITSEECIDILERFPEIRESVGWRNGSTKVGITSPALAVYLHWRLARIDTGMAEEFFGRLYSGENLISGNPILTLRNRLMGETPRLGTKLCVIFVFKAWNAWGSGESLAIMKWDPQRERRMPDPRPPSSARWILGA